jgi:hypothetical protein
VERPALETIFKMAADGSSFAILQSVYAHDGGYSATWMPGLTLATDGNLYGAVPHGRGERSDIFRVTPSGSFTILGTLGGSDDLPAGPPIQAPDGNLFGITWQKTAYKIGLDGSFSSLSTFGAENLDLSSATLIAGQGGFLYGTAGGGPGGGGTVFRLQVPMSPLMTIDAPQPNQTIAQPFTFSGWALDLGPALGSGVDAVHVWAYPGTGGAPVFVGAADYGVSRPDVAAVYGDRFAHAGYTLLVRNLTAGAYRLIAFAHRTASGAFDMARDLVVTIPTTQPQIAIDAPAANALVAPSFTISGWALDIASSIGTGVDAVHVYVYPNPGSGSPPIFLGAAAYGGSRPDVGAIFGARFINSAYSVNASGLAPGPYRLVVFAHSTASGEFSAQMRDITVRAGNPLLMIDAPVNGAGVSVPFTIRGWAADTDAATNTGVDAIHVWAFPASGAPVFLGIAIYGASRPDVGAFLGSRFTNSGYSLAIGGLPPGVSQLVVFAHSTVTGTFNQARIVTVTVF